MKLNFSPSLLVVALLTGCAAHPIGRTSMVTSSQYDSGISQDVQIPAKFTAEFNERFRLLNAAKRALSGSRFAEAERLIKQIDRSAPSFGRGPREQAMLARALRGQGKWREAVAAYRRFEAFGAGDTDDPVYIKEHAECAERLGDAREAEYAYGLLAELISKPPYGNEESVGLGDLRGRNAGRAMGLAVEASTFTDRGEFRKAAAGYRAALRLRPDYAAAHFGLARALAFAGEAKEASAQMALAAQSDHPGVRARAQEAIGHGLSGIQPESTLTPAHRRQLDALRRARKAGPLVP